MSKENYYTILRVSPGAPVSEIVSAYHTAKSAFSKESMATYSLMSTEENESVLARLEEAYLTLSNTDKRRAYDRSLEDPDGKLKNVPAPAFVDETPPPTDQTAADGDPRLPLNGGVLKSYREHKGLSLEDVARITKIPMSFLKAIESDNFTKFPARVYVQGFVKNLASLYKLDTNKTSQAYLEWLNLRNPK